jgi:hypothetical protein
MSRYGEFCRIICAMSSPIVIIDRATLYKYGDLALQVGGVSNETVKYGREFCGNSAQE